MPGQPTPPLIVEPFGKNAGASYIQNPIPLTSPDPGRASFDQGFPPKTMTEIFAGGSPPYGQDVNGILYMVTAHIAAAQAGQPYLYNSTASTAMGGYAVGCVLGMADGTGLWINQTNGNTSNPDTGGAGWLPLYSNGYASLSGLTGGTVVVAPADYRRGVIVLSGALSGNLQVVLPPQLRSWLIVNNTSGAFTTTVKTAAGGGVQVGQGGYSAPVEVYGDGASIYPTVAPTVIPGDVNPTPNTYAVRNNAGYLFATYFNQNSALENYSMSEIYAGAGDGYLRKISLANFAAQISLSQFAGQVVAGQVPAAAVTQYASLILANAALTGTPTAPTPPAGDNSTRVATTAFVQGTASIGGTGYIRFPSGLIIQWGRQVQGGGIGSMTVVFPLTFPNAFFMGLCCTANRNFGGSSGSNYVTPISNAAMSVFVDASNAGNRDAYWLAIGN